MGNYLCRTSDKKRKMINAVVISLNSISTVAANEAR